MLLKKLVIIICSLTFLTIVSIALYIRLLTYDSNVEYLSVRLADAINRSYLLNSQDMETPMSHKWRKCHAEEILIVPSKEVYSQCSVAWPYNPRRECYFWWLFRKCIGVSVDHRFVKITSPQDLKAIACGDARHEELLCDLFNSLSIQIILLVAK